MDTHDTAFATRSQAYEASEDTGRNPSTRPTIGDVIGARFGRRSMLRGSLAVTAMSAIGGAALLGSTSRGALAQTASFNFEELTAGVDETHHVAPGYSADVLIRWGDPVVPGAPAFDVENQTAAAQAQQFGYNCDWIGFYPLPAGSDAADHGLLAVNHEYTIPELMFPGNMPGEDFANMTQEHVDIEIAAHGLSIVEARRGADGSWSYDPESPYNRRVTGTTEMVLTGPVAGHDRVKTSADPSGTRVLGMLNNCAGGVTPWGTILTAEENFHGYFGGTLPEGHAETRNYDRLGMPGGWYAWSRFHDRFDVGAEPNEGNRFGYMVEFDPYDPQSVPMKRTAMGRFKHEGANVTIDGSGHAVAYSGDDERFDYVYRFVSEGTYDPNDRAANMTLLENGTLSVARFNEDGTVDWLPLVHGQGPLTAENGFNSQADILIETRVAADLVGATPMDRPEDIDIRSSDGRVFIMLTNNTRRTAEQTDAANPRGGNPYGHIVEIVTDNDHMADQHRWEILVLCGDPANPEHGAMWGAETSENGWFGAPDNCAVDSRGHLWVTTDGNNFEYSGRTDGVWAMETEGELRGTSRHFFRVPVGAEMCGPFFTADDTTLFVAVQHPGDGASGWPGHEGDVTFDNPPTRWPDFQDGMPPRPSVLSIVKDDGGPIGV